MHRLGQLAAGLHPFQHPQRTKLRLLAGAVGQGRQERPQAFEGWALGDGHKIQPAF